MLISFHIYRNNSNRNIISLLFWWLKVSQEVISVCERLSYFECHKLDEIHKNILRNSMDVWRTATHWRFNRILLYCNGILALHIYIILWNEIIQQQHENHSFDIQLKFGQNPFKSIGKSFLARNASTSNLGWHNVSWTSERRVGE